MSNYTLTVASQVIGHFYTEPALLGDHADAADHSITPTDVAVRSGDYLATLATRLDNISHLLAAANDPEHTELQRIIDELLAIDAKYEIRPKQR